jgi:hypothetical protein
VSIDFAEYWDSPSGAMIAFGMVKSAVTGQPLNVGENRKVDFH